MSKSRNSFNDIAHEHRVLLNEYGRVQSRCSELVARQVDQIEQLQAQVVRLRGELVARDTALAYAREDLAALKKAIPGLPRRVTLANRVETLTAHAQDLMRERLGWQWGVKSALSVSASTNKTIAVDLRQKSVLCVGQDVSGASATQQAIEQAGGHFMHHGGRAGEDEATLEASLSAADLVICQTGCVSHDAYWRVQDHCKRTGKQCVLVEQPQAMLFVRSAARTSVLPSTESAAE